MMLFRSDDELLIRLAERWEPFQLKWGHYRLRPPIINHIAILDAAGKPISFQAESDPHQVRLLTGDGAFSWCFVDAESLLLTFPPGEHRLRFTVQGENAQADRRGGLIRGVRNVAYTTNAHILSNQVTMRPEGSNYEVRLTLRCAAGQSLLLNIRPGIASNRAIPAADSAHDAAEKRWQSWFDAAPPAPEAYRSHYDHAWWVMRAGLMNPRGHFTREGMTPSKIHYVGVWLWDQFFHAIAYRHIDTTLAEEQIRLMLDHQQPSGMLPDAVYDEGSVTHLTKPVEADVTKPPLDAWAVLKVFEKSQNHDFLEEVYEPLSRWHQWWMTLNLDSDGLAVYRHPFSSGLDDSPVWDFGMPVTAPDINTYLCIQAENLGKIAEKIGLSSEAKNWHNRADSLAQKMMDRLWDEHYGMFMFMHEGETIPVQTPFSLLPLWTGRVPDDKRSRLLNHLVDPNLFWTAYPLATVATTDPTFDAMQMWRGPSWPNINYLFVEALTRIGEHQLAGKLRRDTLAMIMRLPDIYEYYNPLTGERPPKSAPIFGWTSAVFIDLALQEAT